MVTNTKSLTAEESAVIGKLLVEVLAGAISDDTLVELRQLEPDNMPEPFDHLTKAIGGDARTGDSLVRVALIELGGLCGELLDPNYPS